MADIEKWPNDRWGKMDVTVTLTGEEWFALMTRMVGRTLSPNGAKIYNRAAGNLRNQITASSDAYKRKQKHG